MNLKSKIISLVIVFTVFVGGQVYSQGFFKNEPAVSEEGTASNNGVLKAPPTDQGPGAPGDPAPVGEGLAIFSLLSGGYFMLKRRNTKK